MSSAPSASRRILENLEKSDLLVNSGVWDVFAKDGTTRLDSRGLPAFDRPVASLDDDEVEELLGLAAFGRNGPLENEIASELFASDSDVHRDPVLGYFRSTLVGHVKDETQRAASSSGGLTTWILTSLLAAGEIDAVLHMKAGGSESLFEYAISRTEADIRSGAKTRYYPGHLGEHLKTVLNSSERYAVVGIPSVLYELRLASKRSPELGQRLKVFVGLVCGHQKSAHYADSLGWQLGVAPGQLTDIDFRVKLPGRKASQYGTYVRGLDGSGTEIENTVETSVLYGTDWGLGFFKPRFSDVSDDVFNETADVVLGDAWLPEYLGDWHGHNIIVTRSRLIDELLREGSRSGELRLTDVEPSAVIRSQAGLVRHGRDMLSVRLLHLRRMGVWVPRMRYESGSTRQILRGIVQRLRLRLSSESHSAFSAARVAGDWNAFPRRMHKYTRRYERAYAAVKAMAQSRGRLVRLLKNR